ncbi:CPBP family intramembrane glutamic endopeptidase [Corynebacterium sp. Marseille-P4321]|uniref:CPBP family intramembrane glutamic endopeptidase n=1 Tax=Corynebacterium sp. Marseille-P4321 TaxID=2736603 RepID=UPI0015889DDD|nr:CPBP family intramembrane glutamic endopeptidase [Corynebacterium sp. Marseille-P4321]
MTRKWLFLLPCVLAACGFFLSRQAGDGSPGFFIATAFTALVYAAAWWVWGDRAVLAGPGKAADLIRGAVIGAALAAVFVLGAVVVSRVPFLAEPVEQILSTPEKGGYFLTLTVLVVNGIGEELVYRDALPRQFVARGHSVVQAGVWSTLFYCLVTVVIGVPLLVFAAAVLSAVTYFEATRTGRLYSPIAVHLTWSTGMLLILPNFF